MRGVVCEIELLEGASLASGHTRQVLGQVEGRAYKPSSPFGWDVGDPNNRPRQRRMDRPRAQGRHGEADCPPRPRRGRPHRIAADMMGRDLTPAPLLRGEGSQTYAWGIVV